MEESKKEITAANFGEPTGGTLAPTAPYSFEAAPVLPKRRLFKVKHMMVSAALAVGAIVAAYLVRDAAAHPSPDVVLQVVSEAASGGIGSADSGSRVTLPAKERLVVAVELQQPRGKNFTALVYRQGEGEPVWKGEGLDPRRKKLSLILPAKEVPPADYLVRVRDAQGDDEDGVYRFTTVAAP